MLGLVMLAEEHLALMDAVGSVRAEVAAGRAGLERLIGEVRRTWRASAGKLEALFGNPSGGGTVGPRGTPS